PKPDKARTWEFWRLRYSSEHWDRASQEAPGNNRSGQEFGNPSKPPKAERATIAPIMTARISTKSDIVGLSIGAIVRDPNRKSGTIVESAPTHIRGFEMSTVLAMNAKKGGIGGTVSEPGGCQLLGQRR
ncbi:MAG TPA: hypothetical protein VKA15_19385, partial [Isosphaeraceae bacterium]|nr:hypothetical protein [Isosphaeraceae bacterium]